MGFSWIPSWISLSGGHLLRCFDCYCQFYALPCHIKFLRGTVEAVQWLSFAFLFFFLFLFSDLKQERFLIQISLFNARVSNRNLNSISIIILLEWLSLTPVVFTDLSLQNLSYLLEHQFKRPTRLSYMIEKIHTLNAISKSSC